jgi:hypothetical protein
MAGFKRRTSGFLVVMITAIFLVVMMVIVWSLAVF